MGVEAALIASGASLLGGSMAGRSAERAAGRSADAQLAAAQIAAEEQRFRPVGMTSRFGRSMFQFGPEGRLTGAGYEASPEIRALQDRLAALYGTSLGQAEQAQAAAEPLAGAGRRLFELGGGYLAESPEAAASHARTRAVVLRPQRSNPRSPRRQRYNRRRGAPRNLSPAFPYGLGSFH